MVAGLPVLQAPRIQPVTPVSAAGGIAASGGGESVERSAEVAVVGEGDGAGGADGSGGGVLGAGGVGGGDDGEDVAGLRGKFDVARVGEVVAVVAGGGDEDDSGLRSGVGDAVEGCLESGTFSGGEVDGGAERHGDDVGVIGHGVFDALDEPAEESSGLTTAALHCWCWRRLRRRVQCRACAGGL